MNAELLLEHFDRISDAADAVHRLRQFILDLALRGKLVEQDSNDEPASHLLRRIRTEKARMLKTGEGRKEKALPLLSPGEPYQLPPLWCWSQLAEVGLINPRNSSPDGAQASFVPMPLISAEYGIANKHEVRAWGDIKSGYTHFAEGDVGLAKITPCFENGKSTVFQGLTGGIGAGTTELHIVRPILVSGEYILIFLKSPHFIKSGIPKMTGTAGQKRVPTEYFSSSPFPLPPLAEQHRIVAKVKELMVLCDRLDDAQNEREGRRDRLTAAALHQLNNGTDGTELREHSRFFIKHLPRLTYRPEQIAKIRSAILDLAVRGRLVPQALTDEPVSDLLKRIAEGRNRLARAGEIKISKQLESLDAKDVPFTVPESWRWVRLETLALLITKGSSPKWQGVSYVDDPKDGILFITSENVGNYDLRKLEDLKYVERKFNLIEPRSILKRGDILMNLVGASIGRTALFHLDVEANVNQAVALIRLVETSEGLDCRFLLHYFNSPPAVAFMLGSRVTTAQPNISLTDARSFPVPIPPAAEQQRIVAKVDELMSICNRLEEQLTAKRTVGHNLLKSVLNESLMPLAVEAQ